MDPIEIRPTVAVMIPPKPGAKPREVLVDIDLANAILRAVGDARVALMAAQDAIKACQAIDAMPAPRGEHPYPAAHVVHLPDCAQCGRPADGHGEHDDCAGWRSENGMALDATVVTDDAAPLTGRDVLLSALADAQEDAAAQEPEPGTQAYADKYASRAVQRELLGMDAAAQDDGEADAGEPCPAFHPVNTEARCIRKGPHDEHAYVPFSFGGLGPRITWTDGEAVGPVPLRNGSSLPETAARMIADHAISAAPAVSS